jgi:FkbH-like protein
LFDYGADIRFRRWAKLETRLYGGSVSVRNHRLLDQFSRVMLRLVESKDGQYQGPSAPFGSNGLAAEGNTLFSKVRKRYLTKVATSAEKVAYDEFVMECFSPEPNSCTLMLEYWNQDMKARQSFEIKPGWNLHKMPAKIFDLEGLEPASKILLYPENDAQVRLVFTWLDLVEYQEQYRPRPNVDPIVVARAPSSPAAKVKCVAWDLDNTLWDGILVEDTEARLSARPEALDLIKKLDERGIIQTVVSKNNFAEAWAVVERLGLKDYFLYPAINWDPKSSNLQTVAKKLNLHLDAFALIDDSPFERAEVQAALPHVRVYSDSEISGILTYPPFDVPVTESTKQRRESYLTEVRREEEKESFGDYEAFLRSCGMKLHLFAPREEAHIQRCLELIQRANQLNLSNSRYSESEFRSLLSSPGMLCVGMECADRFGNYGIVGFASVDEASDAPTIRDLVLSCRVAQKRVEHAFVGWLVRRVLDGQGHRLRAQIVKTERNKPIVQVFDDLRFQLVLEEAGRSIWQLDCLGSQPSDSIVTVEASTEFSVAHELS